MGSQRGRKEQQEKNSLWQRFNLNWVIAITLWTMVLTITMSILSEAVLTNMGLAISFLILLLIMFIGVVADMIGIAVTAAEERPFHAMAADKVAGAKDAIQLLKNAGKVSNFCNDVIGDICGIVSGAASGSIILQINQVLTVNRALATILLTALIASLTVGGKALGKTFAIDQSHQIVFKTAKAIDFFHQRLTWKRG